MCIWARSHFWLKAIHTRFWLHRGKSKAVSFDSMAAAANKAIAAALSAEVAAAEAKADVEVATLEQLLTCCTCGDCKPLGEMTSGQNLGIASERTQWRCKKCNSLRVRLPRMLKDDEDLGLGYSELNTEERKEFYKRAQNLCGAKLAKGLRETIVNTSIVRSTSQACAQGNFVDMDEAEKKFAGKPDQWANLLKNAPKNTCRFTGVEQIWVPTYSMSKTIEKTDQEERSRRLQSTQAIKKAKINPKAPPLKVETEQNMPANPQEVKPTKPLNEKMVERINKTVTKLEKDLVEASATFVEVSAVET